LIYVWAHVPRRIMRAYVRAQWIKQGDDILEPKVQRSILAVVVKIQKSKNQRSKQAWGNLDHCLDAWKAPFSWQLLLYFGWHLPEMLQALVREQIEFATWHSTSVMWVKHTWFLEIQELKISLRCHCTYIHAVLRAMQGECLSWHKALVPHGQFTVGLIVWYWLDSSSADKSGYGNCCSWATSPSIST
jgi:hypothetical protein